MARVIASFETPIALILRTSEASVSKDEGNGLLRMRLVVEQEP